MVRAPRKAEYENFTATELGLPLAAARIKTFLPSSPAFIATPYYFPDEEMLPSRINNDYLPAMCVGH